MMPMNMPPPMQGLQNARPAPSEPDADEMGGGGDQQDMVKAAGGLLEQAVSQFGPQIIDVLKQILSGGGGPPTSHGGSGAPSEEMM
jgi:hypothetical protein